MDWTNPFIIGPLCMGAGVFAGMLLMRLLDGKKENAQALATLRDEFDDYRSNVNEHFEQTSELFLGMTEKYRDVYNHLAAGAQQFGNSESSPPRLEIVQPATQLAAATGTEEAADDAEAAATEGTEDTATVADAPDSEPDTAEAVAADKITGEADGDDTTDAFDPSALDESELADLVAAEAETAAANDKPETAPKTAEEPARVAQNKFRNMPANDDEPAPGGKANGTGKPGGKEKSETRKESATQA